MRADAAARCEGCGDNAARLVDPFAHQAVNQGGFVRCELTTSHRRVGQAPSGDACVAPTIEFAYRPGPPGQRRSPNLARYPAAGSNLRVRKPRAGLWGYADGTPCLVSHYMFEKR